MEGELNMVAQQHLSRLERLLQDLEALRADHRSAGWAEAMRASLLAARSQLARSAGGGRA
jgi:hypothetical protein